MFTRCRHSFCWGYQKHVVRTENNPLVPEYWCPCMFSVEVNAYQILGDWVMNANRSLNLHIILYNPEILVLN